MKLVLIGKKKRPLWKIVWTPMAFIDMNISFWNINSNKKIFPSGLKKNLISILRKHYIYMYYLIYILQLKQDIFIENVKWRNTN